MKQFLPTLCLLVLFSLSTEASSSQPNQEDCDILCQLDQSNQTETQTKKTQTKKTQNETPEKDVPLEPLYEVPCGATITTEYNVGLSAAIWVDIGISAKNTTDESVEGVTWVMLSNDGQILFNRTYKGEISPISAGDFVKLVPIADFYFYHQETLLRDSQGSDGKEMKEVFEQRLKEAQQKYANVSCKVLGFVKNIK